MTQWGGILGPLPPRDSLTGDTNSHTHKHFHRGYATVHAAYRYKTFQQFICSSIISSTFALYPYISSIKQTHSFMSVFLLLILLLLLLMSELEFFSLCAHSFLLSIFPFFSVTHICTHQEFTIIPCSTVVCMIHKVTYGLWSATGVTHSCFTEIIFVVTDLSHVLPVTGHSVYVALHDFQSLLDLWYVFTWLFIFV